MLTGTGMRARSLEPRSTQEFCAQKKPGDEDVNATWMVVVTILFPFRVGERILGKFCAVRLLLLQRGSSSVRTRLKMSDEEND